MARDADRFNDTMDEVKGAMQGAFLKVANDLLPIMQEFANYMASPDFTNKISSGVSAMATIAKAVLSITTAVVDSTEYAAKRAAEISVGVGGADKAYLKQRISKLESLSPFELRVAGSIEKLKQYKQQLKVIEDAERQSLAGKITASIVDPSPASKSKVPTSVIDTLISGGKPKSAGSSSNAAQASQAKAAADRLAEEATRALDEASKSLNQTLDAQSAELGGPMVQAAQKYRDEMVELQSVEDEYAKQGKLTLEVQNDLNLAREQALTLYQQETSAIQSQLTPGQEQILRMQQTLDLMKMTNAERLKAAFLIDNAGATDAEAEQFKKLGLAQQQALQTIQAMDGVRNSAADAFKSILDGSASAKDAFTSFADSVLSQIANIIAQNFAESLFGSFGTTGGGTGAGGFLSSIFGSLFGGGLAGGGQVQPGKFYRVNENQPEVLSYRGEDFLMNAGGGMVKQNTGSKSSHVTVNLPPSSGRRSEIQTAQRIAEESSRAMSRNR